MNFNSHPKSIDYLNLNTSNIENIYCGIHNFRYEHICCLFCIPKSSLYEAKCVSSPCILWPLFPQSRPFLLTAVAILVLEAWSASPFVNKPEDRLPHLSGVPHTQGLDGHEHPVHSTVVCPPDFIPREPFPTCRPNPFFCTSFLLPKSTLSVLPLTRIPHAQILLKMCKQYERLT